LLSEINKAPNYDYRAVFELYKLFINGSFAEEGIDKGVMEAYRAINEQGATPENLAKFKSRIRTTHPDILRWKFVDFVNNKNIQVDFGFKDFTRLRYEGVSNYLEKGELEIDPTTGEAMIFELTVPTMDPETGEVAYKKVDTWKYKVTYSTVEKTPSIKQPKDKNKWVFDERERTGVRYEYCAFDKESNRVIKILEYEDRDMEFREKISLRNPGLNGRDILDVFFGRGTTLIPVHKNVRSIVVHDVENAIEKGFWKILDYGGGKKELILTGYLDMEGDIPAMDNKGQMTIHITKKHISKVSGREENEYVRQEIKLDPYGKEVEYKNYEGFETMPLELRGKIDFNVPDMEEFQPEEVRAVKPEKTEKTSEVISGPAKDRETSSIIEPQTVPVYDESPVKDMKYIEAGVIDIDGIVKFFEKAYQTVYEWIFGSDAQQDASKQAVQLIESMQNRTTKLVSEYNFPEDQKDNAVIDGWAFTYGQALASLVSIMDGDRENAREILDIFRNDMVGSKGGIFYTAYDANSLNITEYNAHSGPAIWVAIAMAQYTEKFDDNRYADKMIEIANSVLNIQRGDGAVQIGWNYDGNFNEGISTEHNLDAYVFLKYLGQKIAGRDVYEKAASKVAEWLKTDASKGGAYVSSEGRFIRGVRPDGVPDYAVATDLLGEWAIVVARDIGIDPAKFIEFAKRTGCVTVVDGETIVDFTNKGMREDVAKRGPVDVFEWKGQWINGLRLLGMDREAD
ncbi:MAG: hypothetical protein CO035_07340, partial [Candidatus Omnitrophica bacterium CG_4_9_14_0_2_um_filter_42_8]